MNKTRKLGLADIDHMLFWTFFFRAVSVVIVIFTVPTRTTLPAWMAEGYLRFSYPLLAYSLALFLFRNKTGTLLAAHRSPLIIDLIVTVGVISLGGSWRSSYFGYTISTVMLFTIFEGRRGAYLSAAVLGVTAFIKDPSGGLPSFDIFFIHDWDMRVGGVLFYFATGVIFGYFHVLLERLEALSQAKVEETRKRAAMEEKTRVALELHDGAKQMVNAMLLKMNPIVKKIQSARDETADDVRWIWKGMNYLKSEFDQVMNALKEGDRTDGSPRNILSIIKEEAALAEVMTGFRWEISADVQEFNVSSRRELPVRRFLSEALMNAWKHSGENNGTLTLACAENQVVLTVADKGRGFDYTSATESKTTGLKSLNHRAKELGADLAIETDPGQGCMLVLTLPVSL